MSTDKNTLLKALEEFRGVTDIQSELKKLEQLASQFAGIASTVFNKGCFQVNNCRRIYPTVIEFYYHEEGEKGLKDPIMYHTNLRHKNGVDYYKLGALNFHVSGLDVTFECENKYRASFLIREYEVFRLNDGHWEKEKEETRSTYIYEDMLMNIPINEGIKIRWENEDSHINYTFETSSRKNVTSYHQEKEKWEKDKIEKKGYENLSDSDKEHYFSYSGTIYKKCTRKWSYHRIK